MQKTYINLEQVKVVKIHDEKKTKVNKYKWAGK